jgi:hypothetical protein
MYRIVSILFLAHSTAFGQIGAPPSLKVNKFCVVGGPEYKTVEWAIAGCGKNGTVVLAPTYSASSSQVNGAGFPLLDLRHPEGVPGLTSVTNFGVRGDAQTAADGTSEAGSVTFTSGSAVFVPGRDEGKTIVITGAGPENASLTSKIHAVSSPTRVILQDSAKFTETGLTYWYGTDNAPAFQSACDAGRLLFLPPGKYLLLGTVKCHTPLFLVGSGDQSVLIDDVTAFDLHASAGNYLDNFRMQAATKLSPFPPSAFPTPHAGTPVALDRIGAGIGYQPELQDGDIWRKVSKQQQAQQLGTGIVSFSDETYIYRITGDLISILLFDVQFSEVAMCNFRAGKNFAGGIVLWHTPGDGRANRHDSIHDNHVSYASYSGIVWADADHTSILHNQTEYNGESGFKNYSTQGDGTYDTFIVLSDNATQRNHYDGLDLSESYPHKNNFRASSMASGNISSFNDRTGTYADGLGWTITNNVFEDNGLSGMSLDVSDSIISGNRLKNNNTLQDRYSHQMLIGTSTASTDNVIEHNRIVGAADEGAAIFWPDSATGNTVMGNIASGGAVFIFKQVPASAQGNVDSRGAYPDR